LAVEQAGTGVNKTTLMRGALALVAFFPVLLVGTLGYRAYRQHENALALAIHAPNGINEDLFVKLGGLDQWVQIRGEDRANPVILIVHGGPGISMIPLSAIFRPWEKYFTVVQWDQRGAGKTYGRNGTDEGAMTITRMSQDGLELAQFLCAHLHQSKIAVLGHSWGTVLATEMVLKRPDLFSAYVGTGEVVDKQENEKAVYAGLLTRLVASRDEAAIGELRKIGPPPYDDIDRLYAERKLLAAHDIPAERDLEWRLAPIVLFAPDYSLMDIYDFLAAPSFAQRATYREEDGYDARKLGTRFAVPFYIFEGDKDALTPMSLSQRYFATVEAPKKAFVILKGGGHSAMLTMPAVFLRELRVQLR
jgi:pimeloyl-ACP methyl ester carboxylesterase